MIAAMNRDQALRTVSDRRQPWDVLIIGGGATGLGAAVDAASRGHQTLLVEQHDFAKGTSSRSTKLIHGGVRYLAQGRLGLVRRALHERDLLLRNAPHIVHDLRFVVPAYSAWELPFYFAGLKTYDLLSGRLRRGRSEWLSRSNALQQVPSLVQDRLRGGILYHDCQFDDARLAVTLARTAFDVGGTALNYLRVTGLLKSADRVCGAQAVDLESGRKVEILARAVVNATGVFTDQILELDGGPARAVVTPSQGIHVVLDRAALGGACALVVPHTDDRRILFAIPWHGKVLLGTTDTPVAGPALEPRPLDEEVDFVLTNAARYLTPVPTRSEILSIFAGLRPLVAPRQGQSTAAASRDHHIEISQSGLVTIAGGKWTTYRHMGEDVIDEAERVGGLPSRPTRTRELRLHGWRSGLDPADPLTVYGSDLQGIRKLSLERPELAGKLHERLPYLKAEVVWAVRYEMARSVEDVLARRTRALFLDARAAVEAAPIVASIMASERGSGRDWEQVQIADFSNLVQGYLVR
jgi:glycerol-3-phosphate dehydrogenase